MTTILRAKCLNMFTFWDFFLRRQSWSLDVSCTPINQKAAGTNNSRTILHHFENSEADSCLTDWIAALIIIFSLCQRCWVSIIVCLICILLFVWLNVCHLFRDTKIYMVGSGLKILKFLWNLTFLAVLIDHSDNSVLIHQVCWLSCRKKKRVKYNLVNIIDRIRIRIRIL